MDKQVILIMDKVCSDTHMAPSYFCSHSRIKLGLIAGFFDN